MVCTATNKWDEIDKLAVQRRVGRSSSSSSSSSSSQRSMAPRADYDAFARYLLFQWNYRPIIGRLSSHRICHAVARHFFVRNAPSIASKRFDEKSIWWIEIAFVALFFVSVRDLIGLRRCVKFHFFVVFVFFGWKRDCETVFKRCLWDSSVFDGPHSRGWSQMVGTVEALKINHLPEWALIGCEIRDEVINERLVTRPLKLVPPTPHSFRSLTPGFPSIKTKL